MTIIGKGGPNFRFLEANVTALSLDECIKAFEGEHFQRVIGPERLCTKIGQSDTCNGDSGGMWNCLTLHSAQFDLICLNAFWC